MYSRMVRVWQEGGLSDPRILASRVLSVLGSLCLTRWDGKEPSNFPRPPLDIPLTLSFKIRVTVLWMLPPSPGEVALFTGCCPAHRDPCVYRHLSHECGWGLPSAFSQGSSCCTKSSRVKFAWALHVTVALFLEERRAGWDRWVIMFLRRNVSHHKLPTRMEEGSATAESWRPAHKRLPGRMVFDSSWAVGSRIASDCSPQWNDSACQWFPFHFLPFHRPKCT